MSDKYDKMINRGNLHGTWREPYDCQCAQPKKINWVTQWLEEQVLSHKEWRKQLRGDIINGKAK